MTDEASTEEQPNCHSFEKNRNSELKWHFSPHNLWNNTTIETDPIFCSTSSVWPRTSCLCHLFWISVIQRLLETRQDSEKISLIAQSASTIGTLSFQDYYWYSSLRRKKIIWILWTRIHSIFTGRQWKTADERAPSKNRQIKTENNF